MGEQLDPKNENRQLPLLGRILGWVDRPGSLSIIITALVILCIALFFADFFYSKHSYFSAEDIFGFYGILGFIAFTAIVLLAKGLRTIIMRPEDYYSPYSVDAEDTPKAMLEEKSYYDE